MVHIALRLYTFSSGTKQPPAPGSPLSPSPFSNLAASTLDRSSLTPLDALLDVLGLSLDSRRVGARPLKERVERAACETERGAARDGPE